MSLSHINFVPKSMASTLEQLNDCFALSLKSCIVDTENTYSSNLISLFCLVIEILFSNLASTFSCFVVPLKSCSQNT